MMMMLTTKMKMKMEMKQMMMMMMMMMMILVIVILSFFFVLKIITLIKFCYDCCSEPSGFCRHLEVSFVARVCILMLGG